jgi:hypothetical protein
MIRPIHEVEDPENILLISIFGNVSDQIISSE